MIDIMTNKERMLRMVLDDKTLKERYKYEESDYEDFESALGSENPVVVAVAKIISELKGATDEATQKKVYLTVSNYLNDNCLYDN